MTKKLPIVVTMVLLLFFVPFTMFCQTEEDSLFSDPMIEDPGAEEESQTTSEQGDSLFDIDVDSMFEEEEPMVEEVDTSTQNTAPEEDLLVNEEGLSWGGRFSGSLDSTFLWSNLWNSDFTPLETEEETLTPKASADLFFDARPERDFRVFGKLRISGEAQTGPGQFGALPEGTVTTAEDGSITFTPADEENNGDSNEEDEEEENEETMGNSIQYQLNVRELFSDFNYRDSLFFRFGKSFIKWGVGYFWSPADILNLTEIDVEDPTAERLGPINVKIHYPFDLHNAYLYFITNNDMAPQDTAIAGSVELFGWSTELGLGVYYQRDQSPRFVTTVSRTFKDFDLIGEAVLSYGSDRVFVREALDQEAADEDPDDDFETALETFKITDRPFFSGTVGILYQNTDWDLNSVLQYFFNGEGYSSSMLLEPAAYLFLNPDTNALALPEEEQPKGYEGPPELGMDDLNNWGQHYLGLSVNVNAIADSDFSVSLLSIANLSDLSGFVDFSGSVKFLDNFTLSTGPRVSFGDPGDEWTNQAALFGTSEEEGPTLQWNINLRMGSGDF